MLVAIAFKKEQFECGKTFSLYVNVKSHINMKSYDQCDYSIAEESNNKAHDDLFEVYRRIHLQFVNSFEIVNKYSEAKRKRLKFDFLICFSSENTRMVFNNK